MILILQSQSLVDLWVEVVALQSSRSSSFSSRSSKSSSASYYTSDPGEALIMFVGTFFICSFLQSVSGEKTSVLKLQVGLLGAATLLQKDLNQIAETVDTSTKKGLHYVLTETVPALLRYSDYFISAYSAVDVKSSTKKGEERFNKLSIEERGKFDEETLVNINNIKKKSSITTQKADGSVNKYLVVTVLVAAGGELMLPSITNRQSLEEALQKLASIPYSTTLEFRCCGPHNRKTTLCRKKNC